MFSNKEIKALATETLTFLLGLADQAEDGKEAAGQIRTELASREAAAIAKVAADAAEYNRTTVVVGGWEFSTSPADAPLRGNMAKTARVFPWSISTPALSAMEAALPEPKEKGEDAENDRAYRAYNRAYAKFACELAAQAVDALVQAGIITRTWKAWGGNYSRYAGCSTCPCSQGVVANQTLWSDGQAVDIHIRPAV